MNKFLNKYISFLLVPFLVLPGCSGLGIGVGRVIGESIKPGSHCSLRYERGMNKPFFHEAKISGDPKKSLIVLYYPYYRKCGSQRNSEWLIPIFIDGRLVVENMIDDYFTALLVHPKTVRFSAERGGGLFTHDGGELKITLEAGKTYFLRWSDIDKYRYKGWDTLNYFQLVKEKRALRELKGVMYLAPQAFKAPVFYKGRSL